ncbi:unnamed protein product [Mytilus edulis]|uniref:Mab-21-like HhH/H2TH-like domain-containing protein n=1 Tax=Mytilus edulis TaxID=6550 RepID=A0A8S3UYK6_MYTED|nr:unnamed protein product [Mytilus edulis]
MSSFYKTLEDQNKDVPNDVRQRRYCKYITNFASHFGKEKCMVVGSTTEGTRLRSNINEGDFDYLIISGVSIPVDALEHREDLPCFVHIRGDKFQHSFSHNLVDGKYLPSRILKEVDRDAFKIMRGLFHVLTIPRVTKGRQTLHAEFNRDAKPGMCTEHYAGFEVVGDDLTQSMKSRLTDLLSMLGETTQNDIFSSTIVQIFVGLIASSVGDPECSQPKRRKQDTESTDDTPNEKVCRVKFNYKSSKDFIAAFPIDGKLKCLDEWKRRILNSDKIFWPSSEAVDKICQSEVYVVAKPAIVDPCTGIDFCFGFNQAEMILASCLSSDQRLCVLLLKALQKGYLKKFSSILTTFHWKTAFYHKCEQIDSGLFDRHSTILNALEKVLSYMIDCLQRKYLKHYFIESNLIAHITETEVNEIQGKIKEIIADPDAALKVYFDMNKECESSKQEEEISMKEMEELKKCKFDTANRIPKVVSMMSDLQKEASDGSKLTQAIVDTLYMVIEEETDIPLKRSDTPVKPVDFIVEENSSGICDQLAVPFTVFPTPIQPPSYEQAIFSSGGNNSQEEQKY